MFFFAPSMPFLGHPALPFSGEADTHARLCAMHLMSMGNFYPEGRFIEPEQTLQASLYTFVYRLTYFQLRSTIRSQHGSFLGALQHSFPPHAA
ncbi:hypothetical protein NDU88_005518 [Pleurodeles waltl]|uniref:Uncharacterized protein n=1 Tax=Pleurodeles waltl TaxID=8319 RepID=A0AAV7WCY1_PLEWA|nr:hypothetical protein NDU88_005518 [Pleurodeles waltl]